MTPKLTVWELFFMLLTVIPVSRMMHSIFMKLIVRIGTVDEEKWGAIGLGTLGSIIGGAYMLGKVAVGSLGGRNPFTGAFSGGTKALTTGGAAPSTIPGVTLHNVNSAGPPALDKAIGAGAAISGRIAGAGAVLGMGSSFATPSVGVPMAAVGAGVAKAVSAPVATAYSIGKELVSQTDYGKSRELFGSRLEALKASGGFSNLLKQSAEGIKGVTGASTTTGAVAAMTGAIIASPLGGGASRAVAGVMRSVGDFRPRNIANTVDNLRGFWKG